MINLPQRYVITVGRQMGSGGRLVGRCIAERLGIAFYDKELLLEAARSAGLSPAFFQDSDERAPQFFGGMFSFGMGLSPMTWFDGSSAHSDDALYRAQCDFIRRTAEAAPCVIVGRSADYVLRDMPNTVNIFVHATPEDCVQRIMERAGLSHSAAEALMERTNKSRAAFYNFYTDGTWGQAGQYHLSLSTSELGVEGVADMVIEYLKRRFAPKLK